MKNPKASGQTARALLQITPVATAVAALLCGATAAQAQQADQTVTVTGIRRGIESAISVKKNADGVVEAISAEDIGKLPDTTIAESLARLPGVTTQRTRDGQASTITIRGLGPDFNGYLLNGREQTSVGDSRSIDLSVYPAELIAGATVYKTGDASLTNAGLAGTIDNKLIDPLSFPSRVFAANAQKIKTGKGLEVEGSGKRYSLSYIDQFADRKIGLALGFVRADGTSNQVETGGWGSANVTATTTAGAVVPNVTVPAPFGGGLDYKNRRLDDTRDSAAAIIAFKPNKDFTSQLDLYWAKIDSYTKIARLAGGLGGGGLSTISNATLNGSTAVSGTYGLNGNLPGVDNHAHLIAQSEGIFDNDKITSMGWRNTWKFAPGWTGVVDLSHNTAKRVERDIEVYGSIDTPDTLAFDLSGGGSVPRLTPGKATSYTDPNVIKIREEVGWSGASRPDGSRLPQHGYSKGPTIKDKMDALRFDLRTDLPEGGPITDLQFGLNFSKRSKDRSTDEGVINSAVGNGTGAIDFPGGTYVENNVGGTGFNMLTFDPQADLWPGAKVERKYNDDILSKSWKVEEKVTTAYVKANIDTTVGGVGVRGNAGVQIVNTDQSSAGFRAGVGAGVTTVNPAGALVTDGKKYTDFLPSLNLASDLGGGNTVRLGAGVQIARPTLTDMRNSFAAADNSALDRYVGSAGNAQLKPFKAKALDLSYEKYFGNRGYVAVAGFYKKLDTYITTTTNVNYDFTPYAEALGLRPNATNGYRGVFTQAVNGEGGNLRGVELTGSLPFGLLAKPLEGFGITASYSYTQSSVKLPNLIGLNPNQQVPNDGSTMTLPGLSKNNSKLMVYYEAYGFSAFIAGNKRSTYIGSVANDAVGGYPTLKYIEGSSWVSAQIGYEFQDGIAKGLGLRLEGNNLNKPLYRQLNPDGSNDKEIKTGATVIFKLSYKYQ